MTYKTIDFFSERELEIKDISIYGWRYATKAMRRSYKTLFKSDSKEIEYNKDNDFYLGNKDRTLMKKLIHKGDEECKFLRFILIQFEMKAPRYFWQQFDTYRFVDKSSESTMHTLKHGVTQDDFYLYINDEILKWYIELFNTFKMNEMKASLPEGFLQTRDISTNYATLRNIYRQRRKHKLNEWQLFCDWIEQLPEHWLIT